MEETTQEKVNVEPTLKVAQPKKRERPRAPRVVPGQNGAVRVIKVVKEFDEDGVFQYRYPMADGKWDRARLNQELVEHGFTKAEDRGYAKYCELSDCWQPATDGNFCSGQHRKTALNAHDRLLVF